MRRFLKVTSSTTRIAGEDARCSGLSTIVAFTDGACRGNGRRCSRGGLGVVFPEHRHLDLAERLPEEPPATNNRAELLAVLRSMSLCDTIDPDRKALLLVRTDSQLACNTMNKWMVGWKARGWKKQDGTQPMNIDILKALDNMRTQGRRVLLEHVRAHTGRQDRDSRYNAIADLLATQAAGGRAQEKAT
ncbi:g737 [Coccomyxa elongata]